MQVWLCLGCSGMQPAPNQARPVVPWHHGTHLRWYNPQAPPQGWAPLRAARGTTAGACAPGNRRNGDRWRGQDAGACKGMAHARYNWRA